MTVNRTTTADAKPPFVPALPDDVWNAAVAKLPGVVSFSKLTWRPAGSHYRASRSTIARGEVGDRFGNQPGISPDLFQMAGDRGYLQWERCEQRQPAGQPGRVFRSRTSSRSLSRRRRAAVRRTDRTIFASDDDLGNDVRINVGDDGAIELIGQSGVLAFDRACDAARRTHAGDGDFLGRVRDAHLAQRHDGRDGTGGYYNPSSEGGLIGKHADADAFDSGATGGTPSGSSRPTSRRGL